MGKEYMIKQKKPVIEQISNRLALSFKDYIIKKIWKWARHSYVFLVIKIIAGISNPKLITFS